MQALAAELGVGQLALDDMIEALCRPGRDPREDLPPPIFRKDVVKFEDLQAGMELRGTVLNVVDFGAFVDVGLSDSGLIHISQLSAGYVRDPHEVVAVGDQVRAWVASIDQERRRVALTMIAPGTERPKPAKSRGRGRRQDGTAAAAAQPSSQRRRRRAGAGATRRRAAAAPHGDKPRATIVAARRSASRAPARTKNEPRKQLVPITKEMEEGKEYLRSFGDLLQFHKKKKEHERAGRAVGRRRTMRTDASSRKDKETRRRGDKEIAFNRVSLSPCLLVSSTRAPIDRNQTT